MLLLLQILNHDSEAAVAGYVVAVVLDTSHGPKVQIDGAAFTKAFEVEPDKLLINHSTCDLMMRYEEERERRITVGIYLCMYVPR